jgi:hypothetical protein
MADIEMQSAFWEAGMVVCLYILILLENPSKQGFKL